MLILASLTTRFVFPLMSLEGRRFWILGLAPVTRRQLVWQKYWLSVATTSVFTIGLASLSAWRLQLDRATAVFSVIAVAATTLALSGLAVGLGSLYPNFEEDNPSRIVSGMGGTLNFILSIVYVVLVLAGLAVILFGESIERTLGVGAVSVWGRLGVGVWIAGWTLLTWVLPMRLGIRHLERLEI